MVAPIEVPDSTDWLTTAIPLFAPFETALRCQVCKDFYDTPMITSCAHTFCSLCIRKCLSSDGRCPACREQDQASKLRRNWAIHEVVETFQVARDQAFEVAQKSAASEAERQKSGRTKRKVREYDAEEGRPAKSPRQTRSQSRRNASAASSQNAIVLQDSEDETGSETMEVEIPVNDGLYSCPICGMRMKEELVWPHIDNSHSTSAPPAPQERQTTARAPVQQNQQKDSISHISQFNYSLLKDGPLRKRLDEIGISSRGPRELLIRRHTEWVNLHNANADSPSPRPTRDLHRDLQTWERSQGGQASLRESVTKKKDFDGQDWARGNKDQFSELIRQARAKTTAKPSTTEEKEPVGKEMGDSIPSLHDGDAVPVAAATTDATAPKSGANSNQPKATPNTLRHTDIKEPSIDQHAISPPPPKRTPSISEESSLPGHFTSPDVKKLPMFAVPAEPIKDMDGLETSH